MAKFDNLRKLELSSEMTAEFTLFQVEGEPVLTLTVANEVNKPYFNELLRMSRKNRGRSTANVINSATVKENRDNDRELYPRYIIRSWKNVKDTMGNQVEATPENFKEFVDALPDWLFDELRTFAMDIQNFLPTAVDAEEVAGNLPKG